MYLLANCTGGINDIHTLPFITFFALCWVDGKLPSLTEARKECNSTMTKCLVTENELSIIFNLVPSPLSSSFSLLSCSCHIQQLITFFNPKIFTVDDTEMHKVF
jgi:hypothetical protein